MTQSRPLQDLIIEKAGELFRRQGYTATTIKQIAQAAGCTTAALYYYFEDGKAHILREVIHRSAREAQLSISVPQADTLEQFLTELGANLAEAFPRVAERFYWIMLQFATLPDEEKAVLQEQVLGIQHTLQEKVGQYVADPDTAGRLAWLVYCSFFGHQQIFAKMEVGRRVDLSLPDYGRFLAQVAGGSLLPPPPLAGDPQVDH
jgi:AcrR family transcriptional regulator